MICDVVRVCVCVCMRVSDCAWCSLKMEINRGRVYDKWHNVKIRTLVKLSCVFLTFYFCCRSILFFFLISLQIKHKMCNIDFVYSRIAYIRPCSVLFCLFILLFSTSFYTATRNRMQHLELILIYQTNTFAQSLLAM